MNRIYQTEKSCLKIFVVCLLVSLFSVSVSGQWAAAFAHGGKTHNEDAFTAFKALQKASGLYNKLIAGGKLAGGWETDLNRAAIAIKQSGQGKEFMVSFSRSSGEPETVYFFFNEKGEYTGSNFTGR